MKRVLFLLGAGAFAVTLSAPAHAANILIGGHLFLAKASGLAKVLSKDASLMVGTGDPTMSGATLDVFDEGDGTNYSLNLASTGWSGSAGSFKYKGAGSGSDPCKIVILKAGLFKAVCKGLSPAPTLPFVGDAGVKLTIGTDNYCLSFPNASAKKNTTKLVKILDATAPAMCPSPFMAACPLASGQYTVTQLSGGSLTVYSFASYPFPSGGKIVEDVGPASLPDCVHDVVVGFPGGFSSPNFCVPALGFTVSVTQTGCGVGKIDDNGGSDFDTTEVADTSNTSGTCAGTPQTGCAFNFDTHMRADVTVGNGSADVCSAGTANAIVSVPVHTKSWTDNSGGMVCPPCGGDCVFNMGDVVVAEFNQILDFTTASAQGHWADIDGDGCSLGGAGPANPAASPNFTGAGYPPTGVCINLGTGAIGTVAVGEFAANGGVGDGTFMTILPNIMTSTGAFAGLMCPMPPPLTIGGTVTRCL